jgi:hypothetical protein
MALARHVQRYQGGDELRCSRQTRGVILAVDWLTSSFQADCCSWLAPPRVFSISVDKVHATSRANTYKPPARIIQSGRWTEPPRATTTVDRWMMKHECWAVQPPRRCFCLVGGKADRPSPNTAGTDTGPSGRQEVALAAALPVLPLAQHTVCAARGQNPPPSSSMARNIRPASFGGVSLYATCAGTVLLSCMRAVTTGPIEQSLAALVLPH